MTDFVAPAGLLVLQRGWLSSNSVLLRGEEGTALIDSGYGSHAPQTLALVRSALSQRPLNLLLNTHLHSDHCGGNAALQTAYPDVCTLIPPGQAQHVTHWNAQALSYTPTGQLCPPFGFDALLQPGTEVRLAGVPWQVHAAPGHDPHSVLLFEPASRCLVSADALWQNGFGVVFPELDGQHGFDDVAATLDLIEALQPGSVIPGHGEPFTDVAAALARARSRLDSFVADAGKHRAYAAKVLLKFKLLEVQQIDAPELLTWVQATPYLVSLLTRHFPGLTLNQALQSLVQDLLRSGAALQHGTVLHNA
ncbi:hydroxyacylglutathione hydrolase [mine drainage metagenome]|uniref:Hydroxyacylglutathione hydrolase n=1 Tax=mine drainage metagenome TaxID=410659 RepID=A0A1J5QJR6_9ZZZZ